MHKSAAYDMTYITNSVSKHRICFSAKYSTYLGKTEKASPLHNCSFRAEYSHIQDWLKTTAEMVEK